MALSQCVGTGRHSFAASLSFSAASSFLSCFSRKARRRSSSFSERAIFLTSSGVGLWTKTPSDSTGALPGRRRLPDRRLGASFCHGSHQPRGSGWLSSSLKGSGLEGRDNGLVARLLEGGGWRGMRRMGREGGGGNEALFKDAN